MSLRLVVSDVDGTIVTSEKSVAPATIAAAARLQAAGVALSIVSARPARGMQLIQHTLQLEGPLAGFNGGLLLGPDGGVIEEHFVAEPLARAALDLFTAHRVDVWLYSGDDWFVIDPYGAHVDHERHTIRYDPTVVDNFEPYLGRVSKMVGVSENAAFLADMERQLQARVGDGAQARRSQAYYLDLTAQEANKGAAVRALAAAAGVELGDVAVLGDNFNDTPMFGVAGFSVAMGNAPEQVKSQATVSVSRTNDEGGWAEAVDTYLLPRAAR